MKRKPSSRSKSTVRSTSKPRVSYPARRIVAVTNQKGGSGKTTTVVNLAAALGEASKRVLVIDLDPQASASAWLGVKDGGKGLFELLADNGNVADITDLVRSSSARGVELVPSSNWLLGVEKSLAGEVGAETILRRKLERIADGRFDFVLIDCPPSLGLLAVSALVAAREILVPVEAHVMALAGLASLVQTVKRVQERLNPDLAISAILPCRVNQRTTLSREVIEKLREHFGPLVMKSVIRENVRLAESPSFGRPITVYDRRSHGASDYRAAASEFVARVPKRRSRP